MLRNGMTMRIPTETEACRRESPKGRRHNRASLKQGDHLELQRRLLPAVGRQPRVGQVVVQDGSIQRGKESVVAVAMVVDTSEHREEGGFTKV